MSDQPLGSSRSEPAGTGGDGAAPFLEGVRVLSIAVNLPVPVAAARLRALGAAVTKVEPPGGDPLYHACPSWYDALVQGQRVLTLDLKRPAERVQLEDLLDRSDLLLTSMRPSALERLALSPAQLRDRYPRLCHVALVGYPAPHQERAGHDLTYQAAVGLVRPPDLPLTLLADLAAAERVVGTAAAVLYARALRGAGVHVEVAVADAVAPFADPLRYGVSGPGRLLGGALPGYGLYRAADGWIAVAALEPHFLERLVRELAITLLDRTGLETAFAKRTALDREAWARERDLPIAAVR